MNIFFPVFTFFFFNDTATTEIYTLSLHDALPIYSLADFGVSRSDRRRGHGVGDPSRVRLHPGADRKSTRLNSSHSQISYAVFCLKKKKQHYQISFTAGPIDPGYRAIRSIYYRTRA